MRLDFVIDTGADTSMVNDQHMRSLGVPPRGSRRVLTSAGEALCDTFDVELRIESRGEPPFLLPAIEILARPLLNLSIDGMLGRDVLDRLVFTLDGPQQRFTLEW